VKIIHSATQGFYYRGCKFCRTVPYRIIPYRTALYRTVPRVHKFCRTVPYRTALYRTVPYQCDIMYSIRQVRHVCVIIIYKFCLWKCWCIRKVVWNCRATTKEVVTTLKVENQRPSGRLVERHVFRGAVTPLPWLATWSHGSWGGSMFAKNHQQGRSWMWDSPSAWLHSLKFEQKPRWLH